MISRRNFLTAAAAVAAGPLAFPAVLRAQGQTVFHLAHSGELTGTHQKAAERFAQQVLAGTQERVRIEIHPSSSLGNIPAQAEGVQLGTIDLSLSNSGTLANWAPEFDVFGLPFLFSDFDRADKALSGELESWRRDMARTRLNAELLVSCAAGFRVILTNSEQPIAGPADFNGLKLRVPEYPISIATFSALGASPTPLPWSETYTALQTGVVDGIEATTDSLLSGRMNEVTKSASRTNHMLLDLAVIMNHDKFEALPPADRDALTAAAASSFRDWGGAAFRESEETSWGALTRDLKANATPDTEALRAAVAAVTTSFVEEKNVKKYYDMIVSL